LIGKPRKRLNFRGLDFVENFEDGSGDKLDLVEARCETWNDCIFVNVSGNAEPLADWQTGCSPCYNEQPTTIFPASAY
jgi:choline monooxygenase